jgi:hypothetical protein
MPDKPFFLTDNKYDEGFVISKYDNKWQLIAARKPQDKVFEKWGDLEIGKDKKKRLPVSVSLGDDPVAVLSKVIEALIEDGAPSF